MKDADKRAKENGAYYADYLKMYIDQISGRPKRVYALTYEMELVDGVLDELGIKDRHGNNKIRGRLLRFGGWPLGDITIELENLQVIKIYISEIVVGSLSEPVEEPPSYPIKLPSHIKKPSEVAEFDKISYLVHGTRVDYVENIFSGKKILRAYDVPGVTAQGSNSFVYMEALPERLKGRPIDGDASFSNELDTARRDRPVKLIFNNSLLDRMKFVVNRNWIFGERSRTSAFSYDLNAVHQVFWDVKRDYIKGNEILFEEPVNFDTLIGVWTESPEVREQVIEILKKIRFTPPSGATIEEFVELHNNWQ